MYRPRQYSSRNTSYRRYPVTAAFRPSYRSGSSSTARALGSARASKNGSKLDYFNCTVSGNCTFTRPVNQYYSDVIVFYPMLGGVSPSTGVIDDAGNGGVYGALVNDRTFRLKCAQFDEYRIVSMKVRINTTNATGGTMTLCSISDRQASNDEVAVDDSEMADEDISSDTPSFREVCESQGTVKTIINQNRISPITRSIYARDMKEKIGFADSSVEYGATVFQSPLRTLTMQVYPEFCPAIYFCIKFSEANDAEETNFTFAYTVEYNCIFRNPKSDLSTFIAKEDPTYINPNPGTKSLTTTIIPSEQPYVPDAIFKNGKETNNSWYARYRARAALKKAKIIVPSESLYLTPPTKKTKTDEEEDVVMTDSTTKTETETETETKTEPMVVEDDPGTS